MMTLMTMTLMKVVVSLERPSSDLRSLIEVPHGLPMHLLLTMRVNSESENKNYLSPQSDIESGKFLEHGEFKGNLYGTSTDGIRELIGAGYQPILTPHFQVVVMMMIMMMFLDRNCELCC